MGAALCEAAIKAGHEVVLITGPVHVDYPDVTRRVDVITTDDMLSAAREHFDDCDGAIGAAAPCDYRPRRVLSHKMSKTGEPVEVELIETADVVATLGQTKRSNQWVVGFALETEDHRFRAIVKLESKHCDLMVSNDPSAIDAAETSVELLQPNGSVVASIQGDKRIVAEGLFDNIERLLIK